MDKLLKGLAIMNDAVEGWFEYKMNRCGFDLIKYMDLNVQLSKYRNAYTTLRKTIRHMSNDMES